MTSVKSSVDTFAFTFRRTFKKTFFVPLALCAILTYIFADIFTVISNYKYDLASTKGFDSEEFLAARKFIIISSDKVEFGFGAMFIQLFIAFAAVLLAIQIFRFVASKKMVNVYYSLGVTRENMFLSKYLCGAAMLFIATIIPSLVTLSGNLYLFGGSRELYVSLLYYTLENYVTALFCFSVTAAVMSCVGSVFEAAVYSGIIIVFPTVITYTLEKLLSVFLYGAPFGYSYYLVGQGSQSAETLSGLKLLNPLDVIFSGGNLKAYSYVLNNVEDAASHSWVEPEFAHAILWGAVAIAVLFAGLALFKHRKAEYSGFLGVCRPLTAVSIFTVGCFFASYAVGHLGSGYSGSKLISSILAGCISMLLFYSAAKLILFRSFKSYFKKLYLVLPYCAVYAVLCLAFSTGLMGYSSKLPAESEIKSVSVTTGTANYMVNPYNCGITDFSYELSGESGVRECGVDAMRAISLTSYGTTVVPGFTDAQEIKSILKAHQMLIDQKTLSIDEKTINESSHNDMPVAATIYFKYELKDGTVFERKYDYTTGEVLKLLGSLQNSKNYIDFIDENFATPDAEKNETTEKDGILYVHDAGYIFNESYSVGLISKNMLRRTPLDNITASPEIRKGLINAIREDIIAGRAHTDLLSEKPAMGFVCAYDEFRSIEVKTQFHVDDEKSFNLNGFYGRSSVPVYESMTSTVKFLTDNGLIEYFSDDTMPLKAKICRVENVSSDLVDSYMGYTFGYTSQSSGSVYYDGTGRDIVFPINAKEFTDEKQIAAIAENTYYLGSTTVEGWYVELDYENGVTAYGYIPAQYLPQ